MPVSLRPETRADEPFLHELITAMVAEELFAHTWDPKLREPLLDMQYRGRMQSIAANHPLAQRSIILADDEAAGWLVVDRAGDVIHLVDIAVVSARRGSGIGAAVIGELLEESDRTRKAVILEVLVTNRASHLYQRLGFQRTGGDEIRHLLRRDPA